jgi:hypothetical protein
MRHCLSFQKGEIQMAKKKSTKKIEGFAKQFFLSRDKKFGYDEK